MLSFRSFLTIQSHFYNRAQSVRRSGLEISKLERTASDQKRDRQGSGALDATIIGLLVRKFGPSESELDDCGLRAENEQVSEVSGVSE